MSDFKPISSQEEFDAAIMPLREAWEAQTAAKVVARTAEETIKFLKENGMEPKPGEKYYEATQRHLLELKKAKEELYNEVTTYKSSAGKDVEKWKTEAEQYKRIADEKEKQYGDLLKQKEAEVFSEKLHMRVERKLAALGIDEKSIETDPIKKTAYMAVRKTLLDGVNVKEFNNELTMFDANGNVMTNGGSIYTFDKYIEEKLAMFVDKGNTNKGLPPASKNGAVTGFVDDKHGFVPSEAALKSTYKFTEELSVFLKEKGIKGEKAFAIKSDLFNKAFPPPEKK